MSLDSNRQKQLEHAANENTRFHVEPTLGRFLAAAVVMFCLIAAFHLTFG